MYVIVQFHIKICYKRKLVCILSPSCYFKYSASMSENQDSNQCSLEILSLEYNNIE